MGNKYDHEGLFKKGHAKMGGRTTDSVSYDKLIKMSKDILAARYPEAFTYTAEQAKKFNDTLYTLALRGNDTALKILADKLVGKRMLFPLEKIELNNIKDVTKELVNLNNMVRAGEILYEDAQALRVNLELALKSLEKEILVDIQYIIQDQDKSTHEVPV